MTELPPQTFAPVVVEQDPVRCSHCNRMLAELATAPWRITCGRCGALNWATSDGNVHASEPTKTSRAIRPQQGAQDGEVRGVTGAQAHDR